jgi:hypothetical protein
MKEYITPNTHLSVLLKDDFDWSEITDPPVEGRLYYKGFIAEYWRGLESDGEQDYYVGRFANLKNFGSTLEGNSLEELTVDFHQEAEDFMENIDRGHYKEPVEFFTDDRNIVDYYNRYHRRNIVRFDPSSLASDWQDEPFRLAA